MKEVAIRHKYKILEILWDYTLSNMNNKLYDEIKWDLKDVVWEEVLGTYFCIEFNDNEYAGVPINKNRLRGIYERV